MTISEIAELADVSVATVSRVINHQGKVSEKVSKRVLAIIEQYHYVPNATGRSLRTSRTGMLLVLMPGLSNSFYSNIMTGIEKRAAENGYNIIVAPTQNRREVEDRYLTMLSTHQVDGVIALSTMMNQEEIRTIGKHQPFIVACECPSGAEISCVEVDNRAAAYDATRALIQAGHTRIGMISIACDCNSGRMREAGYRGALQEFLPDLVQPDITRQELSYDGGYAGCLELIQQAHRPTAIFCYGDQLAIGAVRCISEYGLAAGSDIDVIGFDDIDMSRNYLPAISSVAQPCFDIGTTAFDLLQEKINDIKSTPKRVLLPHRLMLRQTTHTV